MASSLKAPKVSTANGTKIYLFSIKFVYFLIFCLAAILATALGDLEAMSIYEEAKVSEQVASHNKCSPLCHGTSVMPSTLSPSVRESPGGSNVDGMSIITNAF